MTYLKKALECFDNRGVETIIHAGDFVAPFVFRVLKNYKGKFYGVFGNNDGEILGLLRTSKDTISPAPLVLNLGGLKIHVVHDPVYVKAVALTGDYNVIVHGHTHEPYIKQTNGTLIINPGECCGWLTGKASIAILDTETVEAEIVFLN